MDELIAACFLFLHSYGIEPMDSVRKPEVSLIEPAEMKALVGSSALGTCIDGHIYLDKRINLNSTIGKSMLCHEVVHFTQNYCPKQKDLLAREYQEKLAYQIQNQYLMDHGETFRSMNPFNPEGSTEGYTRPSRINKPFPNSYGGGKLREESPDDIRKRFEAIERENDLTPKR